MSPHFIPNKPQVLRQNTSSRLTDFGYLAPKKETDTKLDMSKSSTIVPCNREKNCTSSTITSPAIIVKSQRGFYDILRLDEDKLMLHYFLQEIDQ